MTYMMIRKMSRLALTSLPILLLAGLLGPLECKMLCATAQYMPHTATHNELKEAQVWLYLFFHRILVMCFIRIPWAHQCLQFNMPSALFFKYKAAFAHLSTRNSSNGA
jgi:hypothetical protein